MEDTINKIIQIEEDAKRIVADAKKKKDTLSEDVDAAVKAMREEIEARAKKKIQQIESYEEDYQKKQTDRVRSQYQNAESALEETYQKQKDAWVNQIYEAVLNGVRE